MSLNLYRSPRRPALWAGIAVAVGVWLAGYAGSYSVLATCAALLCAFILLAAIWHPPLRIAWPYILLIIAAAAHLWLLNSCRPETDLKFHAASPDPVLLYGRVASEPDVRSYVTLVFLAADSVKYPDSVRARRGGVLLRLSSDTPLRYGEYLVVRGRLQPIARARNPGEFDYGVYLARRDVHAELTGPDGPTIIGRDPGSEIGWTATIVAPLREWIHARITRHIHGDPAALVMGLMFGERKQLQRSTLQQFQDTGTLHLLAVSGSNVAVVIAVVWGTLALFRLPRSARTIITLAALVLFCALSRNQPSVVRASVAGALVLLGHTWHRRIDPLNIWGGSLLLILLVSPGQLFDVGFQLSFAAALGIIVFAPVLMRWPSGRSWYRRLARAIIAAVGVSVVAQLAVTPILADSFNRVPSVTPLSNLICVPAAGLATASGLVTLLLAPLGGVVLSLFAGATWFFAAVLLAAVEFFDRLGMPVVSFASPSTFAVGLYYIAVCLIAAVILRPRWWRRVMLGLLIVANGAIWPTVFEAKPTLNIIVLDCGESAISLIRWPNAEVWMIDQKVSRRTGHYTRVVEPFLRRHGWHDPDQIWMLDNRRSAGPISKLWPQAHIRSNRSLSDDHERVVRGGRPTEYKVSQILAGTHNRLAGLSLRGSKAEIVWLSPGISPSLIEAGAHVAGLCIVRPETGPVTTKPPAHNTIITVIESVYPPQTEFSPSDPPHVQYLRTVSSGGIQVSGLADSLRTESAIR